MRITFVMAASDLSGGNRVISIYAQQLQNRGHQVTIVSRPLKKVTLTDKLRAWKNGRPIPRNHKTLPTHFDSLQGVRHQMIESKRPITAADCPEADIIVATWWETAEWVAAMPPSRGKKVYFLQHYEAHPGQDGARVDATWRLAMHKIIISQWLVDLARERFGDTNISYVPNAVDLQQFSAPARGKQSVPTVGTMYSVVNFKASDMSLAAFELARKNIPNLKLVAFGDREPTRELPLPAESEFTLRPKQDQIRDIYGRCDVWLVSSRSEGFGLPILEAMACRTPVIATPTGAAPELTAPGGGVIVPMDDSDAMAREIDRVIQLSDPQWRAMSDIAYQTATRYSWSDATDLFAAALLRVK